MSADDWARFDAMVGEASYRAPTQARAQGEVISGLMRDHRSTDTASSNWMDWESQKALRLLRPSN
jgi:hypothetical protein